MREDQKLADFALGKPANGERPGVGANWNSKLATSPEYPPLNEPLETILRFFFQCRCDTVPRRSPLPFSPQVHCPSIRCESDLAGFSVIRRIPLRTPKSK